jgi:adenylate cyclase class IV
MDEFSMYNDKRWLISQSLNMWANFIETGEVHISAKDAENMKKPFNALTLEQHEIVAKLRKLSYGVLDKEFKLDK